MTRLKPWGSPASSLSTISRQRVLAGVTAGIAAMSVALSGVPTAAAPLGQAGPTAYTVPGQPYDTASGFQVGPNAWNAVYGLNRQFFPVREGARTGVIWQGQAQADAGQVFVTWFGADPGSAENTLRLQQTDEKLMAAASDENGTLYTFTVQAGNGAPNATRRTTLTRRAPGGAVTTVSPDSSANGMNVVAVDGASGAAMAVANGQVGLMLARTIHQTADGLNHQSGSAFVFDGTSLALVRDHNQTSGHSWAAVLSRTAQGQFLATEIGDNFPRGVQIHRFDGAARASRVVYTYKTQHGSTQQNPAGQTFPLFAEASTGGKNFFQWSNDNQVYTELGGIVETGAGHLIVFAGERPALDNSKAESFHNAPRDIGVVLVRKDFEAASRGESETSVTDDLIISDGAVEQGAYFTFTGDRLAQRTKGVQWLTSFPADRTRNASRIKAAPLDNGDVLLLWEAWGPDAYQETFWMTVRVTGAQVEVSQPATSLGTQVRLNPRDDLIAANGRIFSVSGDGPNRQLMVSAFAATGPVAFNTQTLAPTRPTATIAPVAPAAPTATLAPEPAPPAVQPPPADPTTPAAPPPPPATTQEILPISAEESWDLAGRLLGGWTTNAGGLFISGWAGTMDGATIEGTLTRTVAGTAVQHTLTGAVAGQNRFTGTLTPPDATAAPLTFEIRLSADRASFTGSIAGVAEPWTGTRS